jgi:hypothetical protein
MGIGRLRRIEPNIRAMTCRLYGDQDMDGRHQVSATASFCPSGRGTEEPTALVAG